MPCEEVFRYPHTWVAMERNGLILPRGVRTMMEERDRDLEDFISNWPCGGGEGGALNWFNVTGTRQVGGEWGGYELDPGDNDENSVTIDGEVLFPTLSGCWHVSILVGGVAESDPGVSFVTATVESSDGCWVPAPTQNIPGALSITQHGHFVELEDQWEMTTTVSGLIIAGEGDPEDMGIRVTTSNLGAWASGSLEISAVRLVPGGVNQSFICI